MGEFRLVAAHDLKVIVSQGVVGATFFLKHPYRDVLATLRHSSEHLFDFPIHYARHCEPAYVMVIRHKNVAIHLS